ncbi:bifunctional diguanylate cyclase/phosphodiesterase [Rheinheimera sp. UJ51]|uniref:putative bifunctional diguanylate cyclase/phosphodiesterase n=1 Tax=Rheinheimera sp. UJ51 TaxID=2892446 RepID=UPI001E3EC4B1|nr:bifunctional diguanylate cyclase/phosphodiesterase [Rheinheimera sp. UJ51]MCC5453330.1 bifunctional diguanylate cyclase/phosphodiesterase [Rheinheimera sp. UJ51]
MTHPKSTFCLALFSISLPAAAANQPFMEGAFLLSTLTICLLVVALILTMRSLAIKSHKLKQFRTSFSDLLSETSGVIAVLDKNLVLRNGSGTLKRLLKADDSATISAPLNLYADPDGKTLLDNDIKLALRTNGKWQGEAWLLNERQREAFELSIHSVQPDNVRNTTYLMYGQNISELRKENQLQLQQQTRDSLTLLPNNKVFDELLKMVLQSCDAHYPSAAVIFIHLTPSYGSEHNEAKLQQQLPEIAAKLQQVLPRKLLLARYKTDGFVVLVPPHLCNHNSSIYLNQLAHKILAGINQPGSDDGKAIEIIAHLGISISPNDGIDAESLLNSAEKAAHKASQQGQNNLCFADSGSQEQVPDYLAMETELYRSAAQGEFELYYQPKFSISSNRIIGYEALLRWPSPRRGMLPPPTFMPLVEETGLIISLDRLVFRKACQQVKYWQQTGLMRGRLALNISNQQFEQADFLRFMQNTLQDAEVSASLFELELPETIFTQPTVWLRERMHSLDKMGFRLILDNFGEGVSSLTQLRQHPLHGVKLSPTLTKYIEQQEQQRNICATLIRLANYLTLDVTATNIETEMQAYLLHVMGCDNQQGHRFSKAVPADEIGQLLLKENNLLNNTKLASG